MRRIIDVKGRHIGTEIDIKSHVLAQVLERLNPEVESLEQRDPPVVSGTPSLRWPADLKAKDELRELQADPVLFYHSRFRLKDEYEVEKSKEKRDETLLKELAVALQFIEQDHGKVIASMDALRAREKITWDYLWALFTPNSLVYHFHELTQQGQLLRFRKLRKRRDFKLQVDYWQIVCDIIVFDGQKFGYAKLDHFRIDEYPGARKIYDLEAFPLEFARPKSTSFEDAVARGKRYSAISESTYFECEGPAMREILNKDLEPKQSTFEVYSLTLGISPECFS